MPEWVINWLERASWLDAGLVFLVENLVIFAFVVLAGTAIARRFSSRPVVATPEPVTRAELAVALSNVLLNTAVTFAGWQLWRRGLIRFRTDVGLGVLADVAILLLAMDALMYGLHRLAHTRWLYPLVHRLHHRYERVRPLTLFALNAVENVAFGALWLTVIAIYPASWAGMSAYLVLNVAFGTVGHLGVEPVPAVWARTRAGRYVAGSSFHAQHHQDVEHNFGFYTLVWDRLLGTLRADYDACYGRLAPVSPATAAQLDDRHTKMPEIQIMPSRATDEFFRRSRNSRSAAGN